MQANFTFTWHLLRKWVGQQISPLCQQLNLSNLLFFTPWLKCKETTVTDNQLTQSVKQLLWQCIYFLTLTMTLNYLVDGWLGCVVVRALLDSWSTGREFGSRPCTAGLVLGWVTICGRLNHLSNVTSHLEQIEQSALHPSGVGKSSTNASAWG